MVSFVNTVEGQPTSRPNLHDVENQSKEVVSPYDERDVNKRSYVALTPRK